MINITDPKPTVSGKECNEIARRVFKKTMEKAEEILDGGESWNPERIEALSHLAEACGNDFEYEAVDDGK